jgi:hypothetical protein
MSPITIAAYLIISFVCVFTLFIGLRFTFMADHAVEDLRNGLKNRLYFKRDAFLRLVRTVGVLSLIAGLVLIALVGYRVLNH